MNNRQYELHKMRAFLLEKFGPNARCHTSGRVRDAMKRLIRRMLLDQRRHQRFLNGARREVLKHIGRIRVEKDATSTTLFTGPVAYDDGKRKGFVGFGVKITNNAPPCQLPIVGLEVQEI